jgi:hypothetical protein
MRSAFAHDSKGGSRKWFIKIRGKDGGIGRTNENAKFDSKDLWRPPTLPGDEIAGVGWLRMRNWKANLWVSGLVGFRFAAVATLAEMFAPDRSRIPSRCASGRAHRLLLLLCGRPCSAQPGSSVPKTLLRVAALVRVEARLIPSRDRSVDGLMDLGSSCPTTAIRIPRLRGESKEMVAHGSPKATVAEWSALQRREDLVKSSTMTDGSNFSPASNPGQAFWLRTHREG